MTPEDEAQIQAAIAEARRAGVPEAEIDRAVRWETALDDDFTPILLPPLLRGMARAALRG